MTDEYTAVAHALGTDRETARLWLIDYYLRGRQPRAIPYPAGRRGMTRQDFIAQYVLGLAAHCRCSTITQQFVDLWHREARDVWFTMYGDRESNQ